MSTRANIIIKDEDEELWFYRHSDGYPETTMPTLQKFLEFVTSGKIRDNVTQSAGWLIIIGADEYKHYHISEPLEGMQKEEWDGKIPTNPVYWKVGAYEPTTGRHSDIEYLYTIDLVKKTITTEQV